MTTLTLAVATALIVIGVAAAAGTVIDRARAIAGVASGAALLIVADSASVVASATLQSLATAAAPLVVALAAIVVVGARLETWIAFGGAVVAGPVRQALDDPFHDTSCRLTCDANPLVLLPNPEAADVVLRLGSTVLLVALVLPALRRGVKGKALLVVAASAVPLGVGPPATWVWLPAAASAVFLAWDLASGTTLTARLTSSVEALAWAPDPEGAIGSALESPQIVVAYHVEGAQSLVDFRGEAVPGAPPGLALINVVGPDGLVAQVQAQVTRTSGRALARVLHGPVRLALENNRLAAEAEVRAREVRASARRIVERGDESRRRLELDLHDGAQRHVLTLGLALQSEPDLDPTLRHEAGTTIRAVLDQLRQLAHGIHTADLDTGGLAHALGNLAHRSRVPLTIGPVPEASGGDPRAVAVFLMVDEVVGAAFGSVMVSVDDDGAAWRVVLETSTDEGLPRRAADRFRALGGSIGSTPQGSGLRYVGLLPPRLP